MSTKIPLSVTADEAVARLVNIEYVPEGFTLLEMTAAFQEDAEFDYENARSDQLPDDQKSFLAIRVDVCEFRHRLAQRLLEGLELELESPTSSVLRIETESSTVAHFDMASVSDWAFDKFGIGAFERESTDRISDEPATQAHWKDVTIKLYANHRIGFAVGSGTFSSRSFHEIGLIGARKNQPNSLGLLLIGLSKDKKYPSREKPVAKEKTAICKLRSSLRQLTGIDADPFALIDPFAGWKPRFKLVDDRRNASDRAKDRAVHIGLNDQVSAVSEPADSYDYGAEDSETKDFDDENDAGGRWLSENSR